MTVKKGDWVTAGGSAVIGLVKRMGRDGSWADVDWHSHTKRMQTKALAVQHTLNIGGCEVTDLTRRAELESEARPCQ